MNWGMHHCCSGPSWRQICRCFWSPYYSHCFSCSGILSPSPCWKTCQPAPRWSCWCVAFGMRCSELCRQRPWPGLQVMSCCSGEHAPHLEQGPCFKHYSAFRSFIPHPEGSFAVLGSFCGFSGWRTGSQLSSSFIMLECDRSVLGNTENVENTFWQHCPRSCPSLPLLHTARTLGLLAAGPPAFSLPCCSSGGDHL